MRGAGRAVALLVALLCCARLQAESAPFSLPSGPYAVGFRSVDLRDDTRIYGAAFTAGGLENIQERARPIQTSIWYPAVQGSGAAMRYADYLELGAHQNGPVTAAQAQTFVAALWSFGAVAPGEALRRSNTPLWNG